MCTSCGAKPHASNTAAVSTWLLTPCSRRMATAGRTPRAMNGALMSSSGSKLRPTVRRGCAAQLFPALIDQGVAHADLHAQLTHRRPEIERGVTQAVPCEDREERGLIAREDLQHDARFL